MPNFGTKGSKEGAAITPRARILKPPLVVVVLALAVVPLAFACGGGGAAKAPPSPVTFDVAEVEDGTARFEPQAFTLSPGQQVTFNFTNKGVAIHNMRIAGRDNKYETADDAVSQPDIVKSGGTAILIWTAPAKAGAYKFRCDYHPQSTGTITVR